MNLAGTATEEPILVSTAAGDLAGVVRRSSDGPLSSVVLVHGSGPGSRDDWGGWPERIADCGTVVLRHDKPGCGGSPGDWRDQTFEDRARESLSAARALRSVSGVGGSVGLCGFSQGGWVALLAAARDNPGAVDFVITISGPGVTPAEQEHVRIDRDLLRHGIDGTVRKEALAWVDERTRRLLAGEPVDAILGRRAQRYRATL